MKLVVLILSTLVGTSVSSLTEEELLKRHADWKAPDAWSLKRSRSMETLPAVIESQNPREPTSCNAANDIYYRQMVRMLLSPKKFKPDITGETMVRTVSIRLSREELQRINDLISDEGGLRDLSDAVVKVFEHLEEGLVEIVVDEVLGFLELVQMKAAKLLGHPDIWFLFCAAVFLATGYVSSKCFRLNIFVTLLLMAIVFQFSVTYLECNRQKQVDEIIKFKRGGDENPCSDIRTESSFSVRSFLFGGSSPESECLEYMRKSAKVNIGMCQPLTVLNILFADLVLESHTQLISSFFDQYLKLIENRGYFQAILITVFVGFMGFGLLKVTVGTVISSLFKYGLPTAGRSGKREREEVRGSGVEELRPINIYLQNVPADGSRVISEARKEEVAASETRRSSDTESIEVIPESLLPDEESEYEKDFEVIKED